MIDLSSPTPPAERPTRELVLAAVHEVFNRVVDAQSKGHAAPALGPSIEAARKYVESDDVDELIEALQEVAHGAITTVARLRAADRSGATA